jgi:hypothetical protein
MVKSTFGELKFSFKLKEDLTRSHTERYLLLKQMADQEPLTVATPAAAAGAGDDSEVCTLRIPGNSGDTILNSNSGDTILVEFRGHDT